MEITTNDFQEPHRRGGSEYSLDKMGDYLRPVTTSPAKVTLDEQSKPFLATASGIVDVTSNEGVENFCRIVTNSREGSRKNAHAFFKTGSSGRAQYLVPIMFRLNEGNVVMSAVMAKGTGSLGSLEKTGSPFSRAVGGILGAASIDDLRLDAQNSKKLADAGIRTRLALGVFNLEEIQIDKKIYDHDGLKREGIVTKEEDMPGIGIFASKTFLRMGDLSELLSEPNLKSGKIDALIKYLVRITAFDDAKEFSEFSKKYGDFTKGSEKFSLEKKGEILSDFYLATSAVIGRNAAKFERMKAAKKHHEGLYHRDEFTETPNNITVLGESVDNSEVVFAATVEQTGTFQASLLKFSLLDNNLRSFVSPTKYLDTRSQIVSRFFDAYLDEMVPDWKISSNGIDFINLQAMRLQVDETTARRAYWVTRIKRQGLTDQKGQSANKKDVSLAAYDLLSYVFSGRDMSEKTGSFLEDYQQEAVKN